MLIGVLHRRVVPGGVHHVQEGEGLIFRRLGAASAVAPALGPVIVGIVVCIEPDDRAVSGQIIGLGRNRGHRPIHHKHPAGIFAAFRIFQTADGGEIAVRLFIVADIIAIQHRDHGVPDGGAGRNRYRIFAVGHQVCVFLGVVLIGIGFALVLGGHHDLDGHLDVLRGAAGAGACADQRDMDGLLLMAGRLLRSDGKAAGLGHIAVLGDCVGVVAGGEVVGAVVLVRNYLGLPALHHHSGIFGDGLDGNGGILGPCSRSSGGQIVRIKIIKVILRSALSVCDSQHTAEALLGRNRIQCTAILETLPGAIRHGHQALCQVLVQEIVLGVLPHGRQRKDQLGCALRRRTSVRNHSARIIESKIPNQRTLAFIDGTRDIFKSLNIIIIGGQSLEHERSRVGIKIGIAFIDISPAAVLHGLVQCRLSQLGHCTIIAVSILLEGDQFKGQGIDVGHGGVAVVVNHGHQLVHSTECHPIRRGQIIGIIAHGY